MIKKIVLLLIILVFLIPNNVLARRGCYSHHGGVAGCNSSGRQICNDGTLSPTCTCTTEVIKVYGCTDKKAKNYNNKATVNNGSCAYYTYGCTNKTAKNYNPKADKDNNSCIYYKYGCMDKEAKNYDSNAEKNDNSCIYWVKGCTDEEATNYNDKADKNDGSCIYKTVSTTQKEQTKKDNQKVVWPYLVLPPALVAGAIKFGSIKTFLLKKIGNINSKKK